MEAPRSTPQPAAAMKPTAARQQPAAKHTRTPWTSVPILRGKYADSIGIFPADPLRHEYAPTCGPALAIVRGGGRRDIQESNAALIVRAVNAHEALVGACEQAIIAMGKLTANFDTRHPCRPAWDACRAALALAEGK
jgi:hypothetical protein